MDAAGCRCCWPAPSVALWRGLSGGLLGRAGAAAAASRSATGATAAAAPSGAAASLRAGTWTASKRNSAAWWSFWGWRAGRRHRCSGAVLTSIRSRGGRMRHGSARNGLRPCSSGWTCWSQSGGVRRCRSCTATAAKTRNAHRCKRLQTAPGWRCAPRTGRCGDLLRTDAPPEVAVTHPLPLDLESIPCGV